MWTVRCPTLKNTQKVDIFEETDFLTIFLKIAIFENWLQILKIVHKVQLRPRHVSFWMLTTRLYLTEQVQSILQPTKNLHLFCTFSVWRQNFEISRTRYSRKKILKIFSNSLIYGSKVPESSLQSDRKWNIQRGTKVSALKAPLPAMWKSQCISSFNQCVDKTSPKIPKFYVLLNHQ